MQTDLQYSTPFINIQDISRMHKGEKIKLSTALEKRHTKDYILDNLTLLQLDPIFSSITQNNILDNDNILNRRWSNDRMAMYIDILHDNQENDNAIDIYVEAVEESPSLYCTNLFNIAMAKNKDLQPWTRFCDLYSVHTYNQDTEDSNDRFNMSTLTTTLNNDLTNNVVYALRDRSIYLALPNDAEMNYSLIFNEYGEKIDILFRRITSTDPARRRNILPRLMSIALFKMTDDSILSKLYKSEIYTAFIRSSYIHLIMNKEGEFDKILLRINSLIENEEESSLIFSTREIIPMHILLLSAINRSSWLGIPTMSKLDSRPTDKILVVQYQRKRSIQLISLLTDITEDPARVISILPLWTIMGNLLSRSNNESERIQIYNIIRASLARADFHYRAMFDLLHIVTIDAKHKDDAYAIMEQNRSTLSTLNKGIHNILSTLQGMKQMLSIQSLDSDLAIFLAGRISAFTATVDRLHLYLNRMQTENERVRHKYRRIIEEDLKNYCSNLLSSILDKTI